MKGTSETMSPRNESSFLETLANLSDDDVDTIISASAETSGDSDTKSGEAARDLARTLSETRTTPKDEPVEDEVPAVPTPVDYDPTEDDDFVDLDVFTDEPSLHPKFGNVKPEPKVDPTTATDDAAESVVRSETDHVDPSIFTDEESPFGDDDTEPRFEPVRPHVPDADADRFNDPDAVDEDEVAGFNPTSYQDQEGPDGSPVPEPGDIDDVDVLANDEDGHEGEGKKFGSRFSGASGLVDKYKGAPLPVKVGIPAALVVGLLILSTMLGGESQPPQQEAQPQATSQAPSEPTGGPAPSDGQPQNLAPFIATVSAKCGDGADERLGPVSAFSSDESRAWVCPRTAGIDGSVLNIKFREPVTISEIRLTPGYNYVMQPSGADEWNKYRLTTKVVWRLGGQQIVQDITPDRDEVVFTFEQPISTADMSMTIMKSIPASEAPVSMDDSSGFPGSGSISDGDTAVVDATAIQNVQLIGVPGVSGQQSGPAQESDQTVDGQSAPQAPSANQAGEGNSGIGRTGEGANDPADDTSAPSGGFDPGYDGESESGDEASENAQ